MKGMTRCKEYAINTMLEQSHREGALWFEPYIPLTSTSVGVMTITISYAKWETAPELLPRPSK